MDKEKIKALEAKYTGNTRSLTEGEAYAIINDPAYEDEDGLLEDIPPVGSVGSRFNLLGENSTQRA